VLKVVLPRLFDRLTELVFFPSLAGLFLLHGDTVGVGWTRRVGVSVFGTSDGFSLLDDPLELRRFPDVSIMDFWDSLSESSSAGDGLLTI